MFLPSPPLCGAIAAGLVSHFRSRRIDLQDSILKRFSPSFLRTWKNIRFPFYAAVHLIEDLWSFLAGTNTSVIVEPVTAVRASNGVISITPDISSGVRWDIINPQTLLLLLC